MSVDPLETRTEYRLARLEQRLKHCEEMLETRLKTFESTMMYRLGARTLLSAFAGGAVARRGDSAGAPQDVRIDDDVSAGGEDHSACICGGDDCGVRDHVLEAELATNHGRPRPAVGLERARR